MTESESPDDREVHYGYTFYEKVPFSFRELLGRVGLRKLSGRRYFVAYVGETVNPAQRLRGHEEKSAWWPGMKSAGFVWEVNVLFDGRPVHKKQAQRSWEIPRIVKTLPAYNVKHNPRKPSDPVTLVRSPKLGPTMRRRINLGAWALLWAGTLNLIADLVNWWAS